MPGLPELAPGRVEPGAAPRVLVLPLRPEPLPVCITVSVPLRMRILWGVVALGGVGLIAWMNAQRLQDWPGRTVFVVVGCVHLAMGLLGLFQRSISIPLEPAGGNGPGPSSRDGRAPEAVVLPFPRRSPEP